MTELERAAKALMDSVKTQRCSDELRQVLLYLERQRSAQK